MRTLVLILAVIFGATFADQAQARGRFFGRNAAFARFALANGLAAPGFVFVPGSVNSTFVLQNGTQVGVINGVPEGFVQEEVIVNGLRQVRFRPIR